MMKTATDTMKTSILQNEHDTNVVFIFGYLIGDKKKNKMMVQNNNDKENKISSLLLYEW